MKVNRLTFDSDSVPMGIDTCTTATLSGCRSDFVGEITPIKNTTLRGVGGTLPVVGKGTFLFNFLDDRGREQQLKVEDAYYVPRLKLRLFSPQQWARQGPVYRDGTYVRGEETRGDTTKLFFRKGTKTIPHDSQTGLPILHSSPRYKDFATYVTTMGLDTFEARLLPTPTTFDEMISTNNDIFFDKNSPFSHQEFLPDAIGEQTTLPTLEGETKQDKLLRWHYRLGHLPFSTLKNMAKHKIIDPSLAKIEPPMCAGCNYGQQTRRAWRTKPNKKLRKRKIKPARAPGHIVSVDTMSSLSVPGLMPQLRGTPTLRRYHYATVFVDHFSRLDYIHLHERNTAAAILDAKLAFERFASSHNVCIRHYHCDNGIFTDKDFVASCVACRQTYSFCGVNAHHQNGIAERRIRLLRDSARSMLLLAKHNWPDAITAHLWPFALRHASLIRRNTVREGARTPLELFSGTNVMPTLTNFHTFGCPVYVLDNALQAKQSQTSKWEDRARVGIYLGCSQTHASSVALILNTETGLTSPQFHIRVDERFETVRTNPKMRGLNKWQAKTRIREIPKKYKAIDQMNKRQKLVDSRSPTPAPSVKTIVAEPEKTKPLQEKPQREVKPPEPQREITQNHPQQGKAQPLLQREVSKINQETVEKGDSTTKVTRTEVDKGLQRMHALHVYRTQLMRDLHYEELTNPVGELNPVALAASMADEDTMYLHEALKALDRKQFLKAMQEEVQAHSEREHWEVVHRSTMPKNQQILKAVWSMKRKRRVATGEIYKWKARLCVDGSRQIKGVNYWDTYAPVVSWESVRTLLTLALTNGWITRQIDFVLAYPQADVECDLYMEIPKMCNVGGGKRDHVLKLKKNLYGSKQAGKVWFRHLLKGLKQRGFKQSRADECVFYKGSTIFVVYVDDGILIGPDASEIDDIIKSLQEDYNLTDEGDLKEYLGIRCDKTRTGGLKLTQPTLIERILRTVGITAETKVRKRRTPANKILQKDLGGLKRRQTWDYRSVIGMLNFLCRSTRPDLSFAVSQAARFMSNPRKSHEDAVFRICEYLYHTKTKGMTMKASGNSFEVFADADFSGGYQKGHTDDPNTAKSRSAYHIMYNGCLIYWSSKLQTETALSTTEAEYICLSQSLRTTICLMRLFKELEKRLPHFKAPAPLVRCTAFEDNTGAIELAKAPKLRPRTKHINIKYHHFRDAVDRGEIKILKIDTKDQLADLGTKPLTAKPFKKLRKRLLGW